MDTALYLTLILDYHNNWRNTMKTIITIILISTFIFLTSCTADANGGSYNDPPVDTKCNECEELQQLQKDFEELQILLYMASQQVEQLEQAISEARWEGVNEKFIDHLIENAHRLHPNGMTLPLYEEFRINEEWNETLWPSGTREFRFHGATIDTGPTPIVSHEDIREWWDRYHNTQPVSEPETPVALLIIKEFDLTFEEVRLAAFKSYIMQFEIDTFSNHEFSEIENPYLLFTFNTERIKDFYSIDPARHASARAWLIEWLEENEPYESYAAFRAANP